MLTSICPACSSKIQLAPTALGGDVLAALQPYRCPTCRLELVYDAIYERMVVAPLERDTAADRPPRRRKPSKRRPKATD